MSERVISFGCRLNSYESEVIKSYIDDNSFVVNSCAVTLEAERQARQTIRKLRRDHPGARIIVTGCAATINPQMFADMGAKSIWYSANVEKMQPEYFKLPPDSDKKIIVSDIMACLKETALHLIDGFNDRAAGFC